MGYLGFNRIIKGQKLQNYLTLTPQQIKNLKAITALRAEQEKGNFSPSEIEKFTGVPANTISKLRSKIKKENREKDKNKLESYVNNYLFIKYLN